MCTPTLLQVSLKVHTQAYCCRPLERRRGGRRLWDPPWDPSVAPQHSHKRLGGFLSPAECGAAASKGARQRGPQEKGQRAIIWVCGPGPGQTGPGGRGMRGSRRARQARKRSPASESSLHAESLCARECVHFWLRPGAPPPAQGSGITENVPPFPPLWNGTSFLLLRPDSVVLLHPRLQVYTDHDVFPPLPAPRVERDSSLPRLCDSPSVCVCGPLLPRGNTDFSIAGGQCAFLDCAAVQICCDMKKGRLLHVPASVMSEEFRCHVQQYRSRVIEQP